MHWFDLNGVLGILIMALAAVIAHAIKTPKDSERASLLKILAESAAAVVVNLMPNADWAKLLEAVIHRLAGESTIPTKNTQVLVNAATAALVALGKKPPVTTGR
jgi:hypothetical protein